ncbi:MAG: hypothetical protein GF335_02850 [Candidatus Moranbacteria bacterium]|nr:hypothetical protein [Candidatus Moranbacteria bacterium]
MQSSNTYEKPEDSTKKTPPESLSAQKIEQDSNIDLNKIEDLFKNLKENLYKEIKKYDGEFALIEKENGEKIHRLKEMFPDESDLSHYDSYFLHLIKEITEDDQNKTDFDEFIQNLSYQGIYEAEKKLYTLVKISNLDDFFEKFGKVKTEVFLKLSSFLLRNSESNYEKNYPNDTNFIFYAQDNENNLKMFPAEKGVYNGIKYDQTNYSKAGATCLATDFMSKNNSTEVEIINRDGSKFKLSKDPDRKIIIEEESQELRKNETETERIYDNSTFIRDFFEERFLFYIPGGIKELEKMYSELKETTLSPFLESFKLFKNSLESTCSHPDLINIYVVYSYFLQAQLAQLYNRKPETLDYNSKPFDPDKPYVNLEIFPYINKDFWKEFITGILETSTVLTGEEIEDLVNKKIFESLTETFDKGAYKRGFESKLKIEQAHEEKIPLASLFKQDELTKLDEAFLENLKKYTEKSNNETLSKKQKSFIEQTWLKPWRVEKNKLKRTLLNKWKQENSDKKATFMNKDGTIEINQNLPASELGDFDVNELNENLEKKAVDQTPPSYLNKMLWFALTNSHSSTLEPLRSEIFDKYKKEIEQLEAYSSDLESKKAPGLFNKSSIAKKYQSLYQDLDTPQGRRDFTNLILVAEKMKEAVKEYFDDLQNNKNILDPDKHLLLQSKIKKNMLELFLQMSTNRHQLTLLNEAGIIDYNKGNEMLKLSGMELSSINKDHNEKLAKVYKMFLDDQNFGEAFFEKIFESMLGEKQELELIMLNEVDSDNKKHIVCVQKNPQNPNELAYFVKNDDEFPNTFKSKEALFSALKDSSKINNYLASTEFIAHAIASAFHVGSERGYRKNAAQGIYEYIKQNLPDQLVFAEKLQKLTKGIICETYDPVTYPPGNPEIVDPTINKAGTGSVVFPQDHIVLSLIHMSGKFKNWMLKTGLEDPNRKVEDVFKALPFSEKCQILFDLNKKEDEEFYNPEQLVEEIFEFLIRNQE